MVHEFGNTDSTTPVGPGQQKRSEFEPRPGSASSGELDAMFARLHEIVMDGLRHGFFDCQVTCELMNGRKRRVIIKAGMCHRFVIPEEDLLG